MKDTVTKSMFIDSFSGGYSNNFSYEGKIALFDYLTQLEDDCDMEIELDPIAFCCEYSEYDNLEEFQADYGEEYESIEDIQSNAPTTVIMINDESFIIQSF